MPRSLGLHASTTWPVLPQPHSDSMLVLAQPVKPRGVGFVLPRRRLGTVAFVMIISNKLPYYRCEQSSSRGLGRRSPHTCSIFRYACLIMHRVRTSLLRKSSCTQRAELGTPVLSCREGSSKPGLAKHSARLRRILRSMSLSQSTPSPPHTLRHLAAAGRVLNKVSRFRRFPRGSLQ